MENASKALIIAGGMLLAMMIVGLLMWGYNNISSLRRQKVEGEALQQVVDFNKKFESYNKSVVRGYELLSLTNLANDTNKKYEDEGYKAVQIGVELAEPNGTLPGGTVEKISGTNCYNMLKYVEDIYNVAGLTSSQKNEVKQLYFECTNVIYDQNNNRVVRMEFKQVRVKP